jgi:glucokinase
MDKEYALGLDVGGTHITTAVIAINEVKKFFFRA